MSADIRRDERRLRRIFMRAAWIAFATPIALPFACGTEDSSSVKGSGGSTSGSVSSASSGGNGGAATSASTSNAASSGSTASASSSSGSAGGGDVGDAGTDAANPSDAAQGDASCDPVEFTPDPPDMCGRYVRFPCGLPASVMQAGDCFLFLADCQMLYPAIMNNFFNCHSVDNSCVDGGVVADPTGAVVIDYSICSGGVGRVPAGLERAQTARARSALGDYFAATAHLEAASVHAFRRLHRELAEHRAPERLRRAARRAQRDEVRHAHQTGRMARRFGGAPVRPVVKHLPTRALDVIAIENAVEGCVRETFGALVASFQAAHAEDAAIARMMSSIARDETRHAALSWSVARWAWGKLDADARARLVARCREAIEALRRDADSSATGELAARAGLPSAEQHRALVSALEEQLWSSLVA